MSKRNKKKLLFAIILISCFGGLIYFLEPIYNKYKYEQDVKIFEKINSSEILNTNIKNKSMIVYVGRGTCPDCREFVPRLKSISKKLSVKIYYLDTENEEKANLNRLIKKININSIPTILNIQNGKVQSIISYPQTTDSNVRKLLQK